MKIRLRELSRIDLVRLNEWRNNSKVIENLGTNFRIIGFEVDDIWFDSYLKQRDTQIRVSILVDDIYIGNVNLLGIDSINRSCEFSILIGDENYQGKGVGKIASAWIIHHAFNNLNLNRVWLSVLEENVRARKLYDSLGFVEEGLLREVLHKNGRYVNLSVMSILRSEFTSVPRSNPNLYVEVDD